MQTAETVLYAGYGANRDLAMMEAIIGTRPEVLGSVVILDVELCVQRFDQIPPGSIATAPVPQSPRQIVARAWGEEGNFETYTIRRKEGASVQATLFRLSALERELVAEWELVEFGWYDRMTVEVETEDGTKLRAETEGIGTGQEVAAVVDGRRYETFLMDPKTMFQTAEKARLEYMHRLDA